MAKVITPDVLQAAQRGFRTAFQGGFSGVTPMYEQICTVIMSTAGEETYGWLGDMPKLREWIGDRQVKSLASKGYTIRNRKFEMTIGVSRDDIEDDKLGLYTPRFRMLGESAAKHPEEVAFELINAGTSLPCYDGQFFFDTDHPVGKEGSVQSVSNFQSGSGAMWVLADLSRPLKPWIFQKRRDYSFTTMEDAKTSTHVFMTDQYLYGVDARVSAGFGFWQMAFGSKATLDATNLKAAYEAMIGFKDDEGRLLGIRPTHLIVGATNLFKARELLLSEQISGSTNTLRNLVQIMDAPYLK